MRVSVFAAFGVGFAAGIVCLAAGLWISGRLVKPAAVEGARLAMQPLPQSPAEMVRAAPPQGLPQPATQPVELERPGRLRMPVAGIDPGKLHSNFADQRGGHRHEALDIMAPRGTPVMAVAQGNVAKLFTSKQGGLTVYQFDDAGTLCYYYAHLDRYAAGLKEGTLLRAGDVLGYVGSTGDASETAPHLHFAIFRLGPEKQWWKGTAIDPLPFLQ